MNCPDKKAEAGDGLMVAVVQLSIAMGSTVGGVLFDTQGYRSTLEASAALPLLAAGLSIHDGSRRNFTGDLSNPNKNLHAH